MRGRHPLAATQRPPCHDRCQRPPHQERGQVPRPSRVFGVLGRAVREALVEGGARPWADTAEPAPFEVAQRRFELRRLGERWDHDQRSSQEREVGDSESSCPSVRRQLISRAWDDDVPLSHGQRGTRATDAFPTSPLASTMPSRLPLAAHRRPGRPDLYHRRVARWHAS